jgi:superoxide dismutase, Fe-Mn family
MVSLLKTAARPALRAPTANQIRTIGTADRTFIRTKATLPDLSYDYGALEPAISGKIMELHHSKHHQTYVNSYNDAADKYAAASAKDDVAAKIALQPLVNFHGGGHVNHTLFWENLAPKNQGGGEPPSGGLAKAIDGTYGSLDEMKKKFNAALAGIQGSGWAWLVQDTQTGQIGIRTYANQDPVVGQYKPLLGVDAWEHAVSWLLVSWISSNMTIFSTIFNTKTAKLNISPPSGMSSTGRQPRSVSVHRKDIVDRHVQTKSILTHPLPDSRLIPLLPNTPRRSTHSIRQSPHKSTINRITQVRYILTVRIPHKPVLRPTPLGRLKQTQRNIQPIQPGPIIKHLGATRPAEIPVRALGRLVMAHVLHRLRHGPSTSRSRRANLVPRNVRPRHNLEPTGRATAGAGAELRRHVARVVTQNKGPDFKLGGFAVAACAKHSFSGLLYIPSIQCSLIANIPTSFSIVASDIFPRTRHHLLQRLRPHALTVASTHEDPSPENAVRAPDRVKPARNAAVTRIGRPEERAVEFLILSPLLPARTTITPIHRPRRDLPFLDSCPLPGFFAPALTTTTATIAAFKKIIVVLNVKNTRAATPTEPPLQPRGTGIAT